LRQRGLPQAAEALALRGMGCGPCNAGSGVVAARRSSGGPFAEGGLRFATGLAGAALRRGRGTGGVLRAGSTCARCIAAVLYVAEGVSAPT